MIRFQEVSVSLNHQPILTDVNLHIKPAEFISVVGPTGVGKTTLLRLIYFDLFPDRGTVTVGEFNSSTVERQEIPELRRTLGIVFQDFRLLEDRNVYDNVAFTLQVTGAKQGEIGKRVLRVLADVGLSHKRGSMPQELSGGEQQRVVIARALVNEPLVILADEPTGNLDRSTSIEIMHLLHKINSLGTAVVLVTHNFELVRKSGTKVLQFDGGKLSEISISSQAVT